jgi:uncharacterized cupin superfamily protein
MRSINLISAEDQEGRIDVSRVVGSTAFAMYLYDLPPGRSSCPYHYESQEEWLLVLGGTIVVRAADGEHTLERGDIARFPAGPEGAHKIMNRSQAPARTLMFSGTAPVSVSVYPDSDKVGIWAGEGAEHLFFRRASAVPWSDREEGWDSAG